jgi:hypothetical protein
LCQDFCGPAAENPDANETDERGFPGRRLGWRVTQRTEEEARQVHPVEERVVEALVESTTIEAT